MDSTSPTQNDFFAFGNSIQELIDPFLKPLMGEYKKNKKKVVELWHVGKFLRVINSNMKILEAGEKPDFIISNGNHTVGLEVTRIHNDKVAYEGFVDNLIDEIQTEFEKQHPGIFMYCNFRLKKEKISLQYSERANVVQSVANCIFSLYATGQMTSLPDFIENLSIYPCAGGNIFQCMEAYSVPPLKGTNLIKDIRAKEQKIEIYKSNSRTETQWLLLIVSGAVASSSYSYIEEDVFKIDSTFDKIFLLNDIYAEVIYIKKGIR